MAAPVAGPVAELAALAAAGRLAIYIGAGVSAGAPARVPIGKELVLLLEESCRSLGIDVRFADGRVKSLEELADEADGTDALRTIKLHIAELDVFGRRANESHQIIAALLREGFTTVLSANWDMGVEHGGVDDGIAVPVMITDQDRLDAAAQNPLLKLHGCISRPDSLQVTTAELAAIPNWARIEAERALSRGTAVFIGIGTVAEYISARVDQVLGIAGAEATVWVVARSISEAWEQLLRDRDRSRSIEAEADAFLDELLRAILTHALDRVESQARRGVEEGSAPNQMLLGVQKLRAALSEVEAMWLWRWAVDGAVGIGFGSPVVASRDGQRNLLALGHIIDSEEVEVQGGGPSLTIATRHGYLEPVVASGATARAITDSERARVKARRVAGVYRHRDRPIIHVVSGQITRLPDPEVVDDLIGQGTPDNLVDGPSNPTHRWVSAQGVIEGTDTRWT